MIGVEIDLNIIFITQYSSTTLVINWRYKYLQTFMIDKKEYLRVLKIVRENFLYSASWILQIATNQEKARSCIEDLEAVTQRYAVEKVFINFWSKSSKNTCKEVHFLLSCRL